MPPHSIVTIPCLSFVLHEKIHFEFCLWETKDDYFYYQHVKNVAIMDHLYSLHIWMITVFEINPFLLQKEKKGLQECCGFHFRKQIRKKKMHAVFLWDS